MANYLHHKWKWGLKNRDKWINSIMKNYSGQIMHVKWLVQYLSTPTSLITRNQGKKEEGNVIIFVQGAFNSDQIRSVAQLYPTLCDPMNRSMPRLLVHHQLPEFTQTHVHWVSDAIQPSHPLSSPCPLAPNPSQHQSLFQWVNSSHEVAKVLEFQL